VRAARRRRRRIYGRYTRQVQDRATVLIAFGDHLGDKVGLVRTANTSSTGHAIVTPQSALAISGYSSRL
jgi:hypothetical protein